ncbi:MAG: hypothetical protein WBA13_11415 [Microcoleaceae cyanobacterium]
MSPELPNLLNINSRWFYRLLTVCLTLPLVAKSKSAFAQRAVMHVLSKRPPNVTYHRQKSPSNEFDNGIQWLMGCGTTDCIVSQVEEVVCQF